jgi:hypothetical protein
MGNHLYHEAASRGNCSYYPTSRSTTQLCHKLPS